MSKDIQNMAVDMSGSDITMDVILKNIYTSCDPNNLNSVPTSELIEFIRPYMLEDLSALDTLRNMLDPENTNISVPGEKFYNVMNEWTQKIASHTDKEAADRLFNETPSHISILEEKLLPYSQSTPRASFGQKLLSCEGLLNLSNVSSYNLSPTKQAKEISIVGPEKTILEEEVKQLQYQLNKAFKEIDDLKQQLACTEDQNDVLQDNLDKCRLKLQSEQHMNHFQENKNCVDDLKEEINVEKKRIEELNEKLLLYEKDNQHLNLYVQKLEKENTELDERCTHISKNEQNLKKEQKDLRTHLDLKEHEIASLSKINEDLRLQLNDKTSEMETLLKQNELLDSKQQGLEKMLSSKRYSLCSDYNSCLDEMSFLMRGSTIPIYSSPIKNKSFSNSPSLRKTVLSPNPNMLQQVLDSTPKQCNGLGMRKAFSLNTMSTRSLPNIFCFERSTVVQDQVSDIEQDSQTTSIGAATYESLQTELFQVDPQFDHRDKNGKDYEYEDQMYLLKAENETLQKTIDRLEEERQNIRGARDQVKNLENKLTDLMSQKLNSDEMLTNKIQYLEETLQQLNTEYSKFKLESEQKEQELLKLRDKLDFEPIYKKVEIDYSKKVAELETVQEELENVQINLKNVTNSNKELEKTIKRYKTDLLNTKEKLKQSELARGRSLDEGIKLQESKDAIEKLKSDLDSKSTEIHDLKSRIKCEEVATSRLWQDNEELRRHLDRLQQDNKSLSAEMTNKENHFRTEHEKMLIKLDRLEQDNKSLSAVITNKENYFHTEHETMLIKYTEEMSKNTELASHIVILKEETSNLKILNNEINVKYKTELNKNLKLLKTASLLKQEVNRIKENQIICKNDIKVTLNEYESSLQSLYSKVKDIERENLVKRDLNLDKQTLLGKVSKAFEYKGDTEIDQEKYKLYFDIDTSSKSSISLNNGKTHTSQKHRSFEKQQLTIDRLREEIRLEKDTHEMLKSKMQNKLQSLENELHSEKQRLNTVIKVLKRKLEDQAEHNKHFSNASNNKIKELSQNISRLEEERKNTLTNLNEKESLIKRYFEAQEYNKTVIQKLENDLEDCRNTQRLVIVDLAAKETSIKNILAENESLKNVAESYENARLDLVAKLSQQDSTLKSYQLDLSDKDKELVELSSVLLDRDTKIESLCSAVNANEIKLSNLGLELAENNEAYSKLEDELKVVKENLAKAESMLETKVVSSDETTKKGSEELNDDITEKTLDNISSFTDVIADCCQDLHRSLKNFIQQWKSEIETHPLFKTLPSIKLCHSLNIEDILSVLVDNIKIVILLLNIMASKTPRMLNVKSESCLIFPETGKFAEFNESKAVKKFTLKSPDDLRSTKATSPDSPGMPTEFDIYLNNDECRADNISPDSQNFKITFEGMDQGENSDYCCSNSHVSLLTFEMPFQDAFPHLSDHILEKLGLHETSSKVKLTKEETEEIFTALAIQISLDSRDFRNRLQKHRDFCSQKFKKYQFLLKDISMRLREHNCIGAMDSIRPVFIMLEELRFMTKDLLQSVGQLGVLNCEHRMTKCWNLVTNYMAIIKQDADTYNEEFSPNRSLSNNLTDGMTNTVSSGVHKIDENINNETREVPYGRSCISRLSNCVSWISFFALFFLVGVVYVHCRCKLTTTDKICPLDNFIGMITEIIGKPPV